MLNFCTLFDSNFITQGLTMYGSLCDVCNDDFHLYIFAFDEIALSVLNQLNLKNVTVVSLQEFEDEELLSVRNSRTSGEYCWTCSSSTILYCLTRFNLTYCTYVDADLYFYSNPRVLIDEIGDKSVLITPHNYAPEYDQEETSGKYCVQFVTFRNDTAGLKVLRWWRNACLDWCYARIEDGKFGDQKYLDDWTERFGCVHVLKNFCGGLAPWNRTKYFINDDMQVSYGIKKCPLCFYHFHDLKFAKGKLVKSNFMVYRMNADYFRLLYVPYIKNLLAINKKLCNISDDIICYHSYEMLRMIWFFLKKCFREIMRRK